MTHWERSLTHQLIAQHIFAERPRRLTYHDDMKRYNISPKKRRTYATQNAALTILAIACAVSAVIVTVGRL